MIEINKIKYGTVRATAEIHFTGGIRGYKTTHGWDIGPVLLNGKIQNLGPIPDGQIGQIANDFGAILLGINEIAFDDPNLSSQNWHSMIVPRSGALSPADLWGAVANHARIANDDIYANLARNISISLRAADIRLRDASDEYYRQLNAGLIRGASVNKRFTNVSLLDLHLAFHSLLAEMGAARDYLSAIVAQHVDAPSRIDSLARLIDWAKKSANSHLLSHELLIPLLDGWNENEVDRWLFDLGEYRNTFLHREPIGVNGIERGATIIAVETRFGSIYKLKLDIPIRQHTEEKTEALDRFVYLYGRMQTLAAHVAAAAKYSSKPLVFAVNHDNVSKN